MMAAAKYAKELEKEQTTAVFVPYSSHVTNDVIKLVNGDYIRVIRMQGAAHESADARDINTWHDQLSGFLRNIASPHVAVWSHVVRRKYGEFPGGEMPPGFCHAFNEKYKKLMVEDDMLINELYLTIVYRPQPFRVVQLLDKIGGQIGAFFKKEEKEDLFQRQREELEVIDELGNTALAALDRYDPEILGCYEHRGVMFSEMLEFLAFLVDGEWRRFPLPRSEIRQVLATSRPFFGAGGLLALKGPSHTQYGAILAIQEYPARTCPGILNGLLQVPYEIVISQSFTFQSKAATVRQTTQQHGRMVNAGDLAGSQVEEIGDALDDVVSNRYVMGAHSLSIMIRADSKDALQKYITDAGTELSDSGMKWAREDLGIAGAFWAQLPGNFIYRVHVGDITSRNFAGFSCLHNYPIGRIKNNQWGPAVTMFQTTSGAPYYFNFHKGEDGADAKIAARLDPNHKALANTVVIGKSESGKTVLEMMLLAQMQKFNRPDQGKKLSCVLFDKDLGMSVGVRAMGGRYYPIKNGVPSGFNPFKLERTPNNLLFLEKLIKRLVKHDGFPITPKQEREISQAVMGVMGATEGKRRLSAVLEFFDPTDKNGLHVRLARWCRGGSLGWLFDNAEDTLELDECPIVCFDVTHFLDNEETRTPTIMYLFHRIEGLFDGRRVAIFMDEFWKLLGDEEFEDMAGDKLVTIRKQDGFLVMFTQSPKQVLQSKIAFAIVEQTANKIFLPNPEANEKDYVEGFRLTKREYEIVRSLGEKSRQFLIKQGQKSVVAVLNLRGFENELAVMSGNVYTSLLTEKLVEQYGHDPEQWLPKFHSERLEALDG